MIAGKESFIELEELCKKQQRIYPDACDAGIWNNKEVRRKIKKACKELSNIYLCKTSYWGRNKKGVTWNCFVPFEKDGGKYVGVKVFVSLCPTKRSSFFSINICKAEQIENPFHITN